MTVEVELPAHPDSVGRARREVAALAGHVSADRLHDLRLLVSEVVTNAVRHSGTRAEELIGLRISLAEGRVRVEVRDAGKGFIFRRMSVDPARTSGWGLYLVAEVADRWGIDDSRQTCVWFELG